ncbi:MAG: membrane protein insertion efficiency factor YidD [Candidatus Dependentiae bacterium]
MKRFITDSLSAMLHSVRVLLGSPATCIFPFYTCQQFAKDQLRHRPLYKAVPAIIWRVLKCNPLYAWWLQRSSQR